MKFNLLSPSAVLFAAFLFAAPVLKAADQYHLVIPRPEEVNDPRYDYPMAVLRLAMEKSGHKFKIDYSKSIMQQGRAINELKKNTGTLNIMWTMTSKEREQDLLPIRIPLFKGLIGWRLPLIKKGNLSALEGVQTLEDLKKKKAGQGHDWPDTFILDAAGIPVVRSPSYENLFKMLVTDRFDYFPRSVSEIQGEAIKYKDTIEIDPHILIRYPTAIFLFVNKDNKELAEVVESGLKKAIADGSFDQTFWKYNKDILLAANIPSRKIIEVPNPYQSEETAKLDPKLYFQASDLERLMKQEKETEKKLEKKKTKK